MTLNYDYILPLKVRDGCLQRTIANEFDMSWHLHATERFKTIEESERNSGVIDDKTVEYRYNSDFFRCNEFTKTPTRPHVLFAGCSQTEGIGGNLDVAWPSMFLNMSNLEDKSLYAVARSGWGWEMIIDNIRIYIEKYAKPDFLFILLPNIPRKFEWDTNVKGDMSYWQRYPKFNGDIGGHTSGDKVYDEYIMQPKEYFEVLMRFVVGWRLFLDYCRAQDIKVLWSTWYYPEIENLDTLNMLDESYIALDNESMLNFIKEKITEKGKANAGDIKKRDGHSGKLENLYWAEAFYKEASKRWGI